MVLSCCLWCHWRQSILEVLSVILKKLAHARKENYCPWSVNLTLLFLPESTNIGWVWRKLHAIRFVPMKSCLAAKSKQKGLQANLALVCDDYKSIFSQELSECGIKNMKYVPCAHRCKILSFRINRTTHVCKQMISVTKVHQRIPMRKTCWASHPDQKANLTYEFFLFCIFSASPAACGSSQARGPSEAGTACLHHSHSNAGSKPHLRPIPQLTATPDPQPTEWGQGLNPHPHGY